MTAKVKKLLKSGKANKRFLAEIRSADDDRPPGIFADSLTEHLFCSVYYGWLVANYGDNWWEHI